MIFLISSETDTTSGTEAFFNILLAGGLVVVIFAGMFYFLTKFMHKASEKSVEAYRPLADPLYTNVETGRAIIPAGWYPTPEGKQDRYHDGDAWTGHFRDRSSEGKLGDPAPAAEPTTDVDKTDS